MKNKNLATWWAARLAAEHKLGRVIVIITKRGGCNVRHTVGYSGKSVSAAHLAADMRDAANFIHGRDYPPRAWAKSAERASTEAALDIHPAMRKRKRLAKRASRRGSP